MESVSRMNSILGTTHNLTLDAARDLGYSRKTPATTPQRNAQIKKLLDSRNEREVLEGLRRVVALSQRPSAPQEPLLFSSVLKNIASPSPHVKKLIYIHLLQYAEADPDTALLSINTIQKTLSSSDPHLRALALRVMSGIRVPVISQIVLLAIKKGAGDMSPLVRKAAALAIPKCARLDPGTLPQLEEFLGALLGDKQYFVAGAAVQSFMEVYGWDRLEIVHKHYRALVRKMVDMDEWGQLATLKLMVGYARRCFPRRWKKVRRWDGGVGSGKEKEKAFYDDDEAQSAGSETPMSTEDAETTLEPLYDTDLTLLLSTARLLLSSRNSAVIISVTRLYLALASTDTYLEACTGPLIALLRAPPAIAETALYNTLQVALQHPSTFTRYLTHFLLHTTDTPRLSALKLEMQTLLFPHASTHAQSLILSELAHFSSGPSPTNPHLIRDSVRAIGRCAAASPAGSKIAQRCLGLLLSHLGSGTNDSLVGESLTVIRHLIQADPASHIGTVTRLAKNLDGMTNPSARASVVWLVGEFAGISGGDNISADVLRILARGFVDEEEGVRAQIVLLAAKVYVCWLNAWNAENGGGKDDPSRSGQANYDLVDGSIAHTSTSNNTASFELPDEEGGFRDSSETTTDKSRVEPSPSTPQTLPNSRMQQSPPTDHPIPVLFTYILLLARYDTSYDLRDRARLYKSLLSIPTSTQLASLLLLAPKPVPSAPSPSESRRDFMLGSASLVVGAEEAGSAGLRGYEALPDWIDEGQEPSRRLRDDGDAASGYVGQSVTKSASERLDVGSKAVAAKPVAKTVGDKSLDDWLAEEEGETSEESEDDESGEAESGEEGSGSGSEEDVDESDEEDNHEKGRLIGR